VIGAGLAVAALPFWGERFFGGASPVSASIPVGRFLVDERFAEAVAMAAKVAAAGVPTTAMARDVLGLWHDDLLPAFRGGRLAALGGITTETALFLIRTLAADERLRVISQAAHLGAAGQVRLVSWTIGPRP
jgi:HEAT repeat protein